MFSCACGEITSSNAERPCQDCGHFPYFHTYEEEEVHLNKKDEQSIVEAKRLDIKQQIREEQMRMKMARREFNP